jgi:leucyl aminopeptidase
MQIRISTDAPASLEAAAIVVPVFTDAALDGSAQQWNDELGGTIAEIIAAGEMTGKASEMTLIHAQAKNAPGVRRVLVVGMGDRAKFKGYELTRYAGAAVRYLGKRGFKQIAFTLPGEALHHGGAAASLLVEGVVTGTFDTATYRSESDRPIVIEELILLATAGTHRFDRDALAVGAARGRILGEAVNLARTLALTPANDMTPIHLADRAADVARKHGLHFDALDEKRMEALGMGSILGVSRGSDEEARMIVLRYEGDPSSKEVLALVGKGLTFDSGGISIKPAENMHEMKYDMSGGAGVIAAMSAIGELKPKVNVIGVVPASENLPGGRAMKPGDVLRAMNGKTIEVINTDAEGRLILADGLCYARELGATRLVDCATLTGACVVALGHAASGVMSNDDEFVQHFLRIANTTGERYWQLPLYEDYSKAVKSEIADLRNSTGRAAGCETAGAFLQNFVAAVPWIHLDIAGTAYLDDPGPHMAKGPTGTPVRALVALAEDFGRHKHGDGASNGQREASAART